jgi:hypothetical protein
MAHPAAKVRLLPFLIAVSLLAAATDFSGTWKLNVEKSKLPADSPIAGRVMKTEKIGLGQFRDTFEDTDKAGKKRVHEAVHSCDAKEVPLPRLGAGYTEICEDLDTFTSRTRRKKDGQVVLEITGQLSADGKILTATHKGIRDGVSFEAVYVYEKQ